MDRKIYQPTEKQLEKWSELHFSEMPSDEEFKARWASKHNGKERGWGIGKRDWIIANLAGCTEYQMGLWQARVDWLQGLDYQAPVPHDSGKNMNAYNLGYYRGWRDGHPLAGIDAATVARLQTEYGKQEA